MNGEGSEERRAYNVDIQKIDLHVLTPVVLDNIIDIQMI